MMVESLSCLECGHGTFVLSKIDNELHSTCISCGYIICMRDLLAECKEMAELKKREVDKNAG